MLYTLTLRETIDQTTELRVLEWHKQENSLCSLGELLVELESYKAVVEIRAEQSAYLRRIITPAGSVQGLGKPIAVFSDAPDEPLPGALYALQELAVDYSFM